MKGGGVDLHGRPRPVPRAPILVEHDPILTHGRPSRPTHPLPTAPTARPASCLPSQLKLMRMTADNEFSQNQSDTEISTQGRSIGGHRHQPKTQAQDSVGAMVDEGWWGGPSWSPAC